MGNKILHFLVYVHVNQSDGVTKGVQLQMVLSDRNYNPQLFAPSWKIKITQLECPGPKKGLQFYNKDVEEDFPLLGKTLVCVRYNL